MTEAAFPVNDLLRRRLQTGLTVVSLTTCVASTLFLLLFSSQIGLGIASTSTNTLNSGTSTVFSQFITFVGVLIFIVGAVIISFIVFLMMAQRTRDFGLMKATGCPNSLVFGYFVTELLGVTFVGCILGVILGLTTDYAIINMPMFQVYNSAPNFWFAPLIFAVYFVFALFLGAKPLFDAAKMSPLKALSSVQYFGLGKGDALKPLSRTSLTLRIASRSLFRRKSATIRIVIFLSTVFLLLTVAIAGGIIANNTSSSWLTRASGEKVILISTKDMAEQYKQLLLSFSGTKVNQNFNYANHEFAIPDATIDEIGKIDGVLAVDSRLVLMGTLQEIPGFKVDPDTLATITVGDHRKCETLLVGVIGGKTITNPYTSGFFLNETSILNVVVGDSVSKAIYSSITKQLPYGQITTLGDALVESARIGNSTLKISGIAVDPLNNGNVTYIPLQLLEQATGVSSPNIIFVTVNQDANYLNILEKIQSQLQSSDSNVTAIDLTPTLTKNIDFLNSLWGVIMFLPAFALAAAVLCLVSFLMLSIEEQHQEFAILRATGAKPLNVVTILAFQSLTVLLSSFGIGVSIGTIVCVIILTAHPVVSAVTGLVISGWLLAALLVMFLISLYPAIKFARKSILSIMS